MSQRAKRPLAAVAGVGAVMASVSGTALAVVSNADATAVTVDQDINNDWGQTPEEIAAEIRSQVAADPTVVGARSRYQRALQVLDARKAAVADALRAYHRAQRTRSHLDDRRTKAAVADARRALAKASDAATTAKGALEQARAVATEQITALHYVLDPNPTPTPTDTVTPTPTPTDTVTPTPTPTLINGTYLGVANDTSPYGTIQVSITVVNSLITVVTTPVYPTSGDSKAINRKALPILQNEAIAAQSSKIASVSGATYTSKAFKQSLQSAILLSGLPA